MKEPKPFFALLIFLAISFAIFYVPQASYVKSYLDWFNTYWHEWSHGFAAVLTGGDIQGINIDYNGAGTCYSSGGIGFLITFSGYFGAAIWGAILFSVFSAPRETTPYFLLLIGMHIISTIFFVMNFHTLIILLIMFATIAILWYFSGKAVVKLIGQFIGVYIMFSAIITPTYLFSYTDSGDHVGMYNHTGISPTFWVYVWVLLCSLVLGITVYLNYGKIKI